MNSSNPGQGATAGKRRLRLDPCHVVRASSQPEERTVVVLGMPSGGTSMISGTLGLLGIPMGEEVDPANQEDLEFQGLTALSPVARKPRLHKIIDERNARNRVWGWKDPHSRVYLREVLPLLRNPHLIFVFRDNLAAAQRINFRSGIDHLVTVKQYLDHMKDLVDIAETTEAPLLLVSYERTLTMGEEYARAMADFVGVGLDDERLLAIQKYVRPNRGGAAIDAKTRSTDEAHWARRMGAKEAKS